MAQPPLHEHITCVAAPAVWLSPRSGQLTGGVDGLYVADRRVLSRLVVTLDGVEPTPDGAELHGVDTARFHGRVGELTVERLRTATRSGGSERIIVRNTGARPVQTTLAVNAAADLALVGEVKAGTDDRAREVPLPDGMTWTAPDGYQVRLNGPTRAKLSLHPGEITVVTLTVVAVPPRVEGFQPAAPAQPAPWAAAPLTMRSADPRLDALVRQGIADLGALLLADHGDVYCAAGSPWYLTLFGRDALWTARLALPLGHELAAGTLRALARYQGIRHDPATEEAPGKIPHELRPTHAAHWLPPVYYGTVDATPLFVITLAEAWRWGMPADQVAALLPNARAALGWLAGFPEFVSYRGSEGKLRNQGWKDSPDSVQHVDGRLATPPVALCEVQAYAYQAAILGADLFDTFGERDGPRWREWAAALAERFRARFWVDGYPAIAVDGDGRPVDGPASNIGHLLGTGLLTPEEEQRAARRLADLDSGWGLRTLTSAAAGFDPLSYHAGSVWPHDTMITILGLARCGAHDLATRLVRGLIAAASQFDHRLPELYGGNGAPSPPWPYPPACRPQAWSAAVSPALVTALLGLDVDLPAGRMSAAPLPGIGELTVCNVRLGTARVTLRASADGKVSASGLPDGVALTV